MKGASEKIDIVMETRHCLQCGAEFRVSEKSNQKFHSDFCEKRFQGTFTKTPPPIYKNHGKRKAPQSLSLMLENVEKAKNENRLTTSFEKLRKEKSGKNLEKHGTKDAQVIQFTPRSKEENPESDQSENTSVIAKPAMQDDVSGAVSTESERTKHRGSGMKLIKNTQENSSTDAKTEGSQRELFPEQLMNLETAQSASMNLIEESANHLYGLMKQLKPKKNASNIEVVDTETVHAACNCAKNIRELMNLKLNAMKFQNSLKKAK
ncbi:MAG: hypothetical protein ACXVB4_01525 [Pseudobdellovibrionaceae bacterium]